MQRQSLTAEQFMKDAKLLAALMKHVVYCPPFGPFIHHSSVTLSNDLLASYDTYVSPAVVQQIFYAHFDVDHFRSWPSLYVASDLLPSDVQDL